MPNIESCHIATIRITVFKLGSCLFMFSVSMGGKNDILNIWLTLGIKFCRWGHQNIYQFFYTTDMLIPCCTGMQYKELVVGINLLLTPSDVPALVCGWGVFLFSFWPSFFGSCVFGSNQTQMDRGLTLWMSHCSADKNGLAKVWESQPFWCRPPTVSTQRCTSSPLFYANSCGSF